MLQAGPASAIPSPELVIGSVSSLSQVFAVGIAMASGMGAVVLRKLGLPPGVFRPGPEFWPRFAVLTLVFALVLGGLNVWQYSTHRAESLERLQATLLRPAQFEGTRIKDESLKETSFSSQAVSPLAISTSEAEKLLHLTGPDRPLFFDIREAAENEMGTLPGSTHVRFPDFQGAASLAPGQQVILFCHNGNRSSETCAELAKRGIDCRFIAGGIEKWIVEGREFSDHAVRSLSDLRPIPDYPNRDVLLTSDQFAALVTEGDLQIVDTRYPGDFAAGHLPGAVNIPIRALPSSELRRRISALGDKPTVVACYDRRSCFMGQVLGLELSRSGVEFLGRYTTPWDYFVPPKPKPHVADWLEARNKTIWSQAAHLLASALDWVHEKSHMVWGLLGLALLSRILVLPVALKSERDQMVAAAHADELAAIKAELAHDPTRRARAIQAFYDAKGMTPMRNLIALLFLPVMMLGVSSAGLAGSQAGARILWIADLGAPDPVWVLPVLFCALAGLYLVWAVAKSRRQALLWLGLGLPVLFALVANLNAAAVVYLNFSLLLLLAQRAYVVGWHKKFRGRWRPAWRGLRAAGRPAGVIPLSYQDELRQSGNKSYRLSVLLNHGFPVPPGVVIRADAIARFVDMTTVERDEFAQRVWKMAGQKPCAVRSSAAGEDGIEQSFAGVFDSVLGVTGECMTEALDTVIRSFSSGRVDSYDRDGDHSGSGNVLIQQMVASDYAGVLFTQDPNAPGLAMVEWVRGQGEDLVSGRVTPCCQRFGRASGQITGTAAPDGPDLAPLLDLGRRAEAIFGCPQDIEWAHADGQFHIVQSRDITTLAGGSQDTRLRSREWRRVFDRFGTLSPDQVVLEQDEMSEVLPRPTPLSFSLMGCLWAPGGSVDLACRDLGVPYCLPEGGNGHLVRFFGKTYVDSGLKHHMTGTLKAAQAKKLRERGHQARDHIRETVIPDLREKVGFWQALDFAALPVDQIVRCLDDLRAYLVRDVYAEAEKVNILTEFAMGEANQAAKESPELRARLMQAELPNAPTTLIKRFSRLKGETRTERALELLGHRAMFDYELSTPRYREAPRLLAPLLDNPVETLGVAAAGSTDLPEELAEIADRALDLQDLKEQTKHEALRVFAEIRRAALALGERSGLGRGVFHLTYTEILEADWCELGQLAELAQTRRAEDETLIRLAPKAATLTLRDCEVLSLGDPVKADKSQLSGTCVAGEGPVTSRVFRILEDPQTGEANFDGFTPGDILVCDMINPAWLAQVQRAGAVLSEVGGWLSHMAIVAREKNLLMLVGCSGLDQLVSGDEVTVCEDGSIELQRESLRARGVA